MPITAPAPEVEDEVAPAPPEETQRETLSRVYDELSKPPAEEGDEAPVETRARDGHGRFLPKEEPKAEPKVAAKPPEGRGRQTAPAELETPDPKRAKVTPIAPPLAEPTAAKGFEGGPPTFLRPQMRDLWNKLGPEFAGLKEDFHRRDMEALSLLEKTKGDRQILQAIGQTIDPFKATLAAEGGNVVTALGAYLQAATIMRQGAPQVKANWVAELCNTYQIDLRMLDEALAARQGGRPPPQSNGQQQPQYQPIDVRAMVQEETRRANAESNLERQIFEQKQSYQQWQAAEEREWLPLVRGRMAQLLEAAARDGEDMSFDEAYAAAMHSTKGIPEALKQRQEAEAAKTQAASRARRSSMSLRPGAPPQGEVAKTFQNESQSRRADLEAAMEEHGWR